MFRYRPVRELLDESMKESVAFLTKEHMLDYIVYKHILDGRELVSKEDLIVGDNEGKDGRIDWLETRYVLTKRYGKKVYDTPQVIGYCSIEDLNKDIPSEKAASINIKGLSKHYLLKELYDAARPYDMTVTVDECAELLHNTIGIIREWKGKKLYVDVFGDTLDSRQYNSHNGNGLGNMVVRHIIMTDIYNARQMLKSMFGNNKKE